VEKKGPFLKGTSKAPERGKDFQPKNLAYILMKKRTGNLISNDVRKKGYEAGERSKETLRR